MAGTVVCNVINTDTGIYTSNNALNGVAKAWVNFNGGNGNTAGAINGSFNVSSITVNGTGDYTVNFTTAISSANYSWVAAAFRQPNSVNQAYAAQANPSVSAFRFQTSDASNSLANMTYCSVTIFNS